MSVIDKLSDDSFLATSTVVSQTNTIIINNAGQLQGSTVQSQDSGLKLLKENSASNNDATTRGTSVGRPKRSLPGKMKKSFNFKFGQRLLKFRLNEISNKQLVRTVGTQIGSSRSSTTETDVDSEVAQNLVESGRDLDEAAKNRNQEPSLNLDLIKKELRRHQWRESKKKLRSAYSADPDVHNKKRNKRLQDQRERSSLARQKLTEPEKVEARRKHQLYKAERLKNENNNQRFWRLIKGRQYRKNGYHNNAIHMRYDRSIGLYGFTKPTFPKCSSPDDQSVETQIWRFNFILKKVLSGKPIPENLFVTFAERGIDLPRYFFDDFVKDQQEFESEV